MNKVNWFDGIEFANPEWLWALIAIPAIATLRWALRSSGTVRHPSFSIGGGLSWAAIRPALPLLSYLALASWIVAIARPQSNKVTTQIDGGEGIDIMLTVDVSYSMEALDLKPNRLGALKEVAKEFVESRPADRIGLVVYGSEAFTQTPLTTDHSILITGIDDLSTSMFEGSTAIGMGLATAVNRIVESEAESKVIILMTDGENNSGNIDPLSAAELASKLGVRVYTIGIGASDYAQVPVQTINGRKIYQRRRMPLDEELLQTIAKTTNGHYFRATNKSELQGIYAEIDRLETSKVEELKYVQYEEHFYPWAIAGLALLAFEFILKQTVFRSVV